MIALTLNNISKRFGKKVLAVNNLDLQVEEKQFVVLLGPSGCGKTTTLRMIAGLEHTTTGSILLYDRDITEAPPRSRNISMVFQNYAVWPHMTVFDNIAFALKLHRIEKSIIDSTVHEVAEMVKIDELLERFPRQLSGGQQQRVALARALAVHPKLFLMDEPLSNLDAKLRTAMRTELKAIHQRTEATSIFVTHDQSEAMSMADRIVIMRNGEVVQTGSPDDVYFRSADMFVAGFIGTPPTNFFPVTIERNGAHLSLKSRHFEVPLSPKVAGELASYSKRDLMLGVRPEDILFTTDQDAILRKDVMVIEPQGSHKIVAIELDGMTLKISAAPSTKVEIGEVAHLRFNLENLHFFDPETEKRVAADSSTSSLA
jgi:multiple sugar transport system ATP-binding protein